MDSLVKENSLKILGGIILLSLGVLIGLGTIFEIRLGDLKLPSGFIILIGILASLFLWMIFRWPRLGLILILLTVPVEVGLIYVAGFGVYIVQPLIMLTTLAILLAYDMIHGKVSIPKELLPVIILWIAYIYSGFITIDNQVTWGGIIYFIPLICLCWLIARVAGQTESLKFIVSLSIWIGVAIALLGIIQTIAYRLGFNLAINPYQYHFLTTYGRPSGLESEPNWFGIYVGMVLAIAFPFWIRRQSLGRLPINAIVICILGLAVLLSGTRSIWVGLLVALAATNLINTRLWGTKLGRLIPLAGLLILGVILLYLSNPKIIGPLARLSSTFDANEYNSALRVYTWQMALENILQRPWTGYGLNSWEILSQNYPNINNLPAVIGGKSVPNIFLNNWLAAGILGILVTTYMIGYYSFKLIKLVRYRRDPLTSAFGEAMLGGWIAIIVASIFTNAFIHNFFWFMVALIIATLTCFRRSLNPVRSPKFVSS